MSDTVIFDLITTEHGLLPVLGKVIGVHRPENGPAIYEVRIWRTLANVTVDEKDIASVLVQGAA